MPHILLPYMFWRGISDFVILELEIISVAGVSFYYRFLINSKDVSVPQQFSLMRIQSFINIHMSLEP
jgi:hypothetical protein